MSLREYLAAIPKCDLNRQLTGALVPDSLLMIARQNGVPDDMDDFDAWAGLLREPDDKRLDELAKVAGGWTRYPEDIARVVYDMGLQMHKRNVRYAEVSVAPSEMMPKSGMGFDAFINALNDGRDRVSRAWGVDMRWILSIPRDNPRAGDDAARWATGAAARKGNVVAIGLTGAEDSQPVGQFKRAFATARKKDIPSVAQAGHDLGPAGAKEALAELQPGRLLDAWGIHDDADCLAMLREAGAPLIVSIHRALRRGQVKDAADFPLRQLLDSGLDVALATGMPQLYRSSLVDEYALAGDACGLSHDEVTALARRSFELSLLEADAKADMLAKFDQQVAFARAQYLTG